jgi:hypothetical protein
VKLLERQFLFTRCLGLLLRYIHTLPGVEVTMGEGYIGDSIDKPHEDTPHVRNSLHFRRLAVDLNLFVEGKYVTGEHPLWYTIGDYWKSLSPECRWGGDFKARDFNHFSIQYGGVA